jgi:hypothetical protein
MQPSRTSRKSGPHLLRKNSCQAPQLLTSIETASRPTHAKIAYTHATAAPEASRQRPTKPDCHILVRMPDHAANKLSNYSIKKHLIDNLALNPMSLLDARRIPTGWAIFPDSIETRDTILAS